MTSIYLSNFGVMSQIYFTFRSAGVDCCELQLTNISYTTVTSFKPQNSMTFQKKTGGLKTYFFENTPGKHLV